MNASVVLITFVFFHRFCSLVILLLDIVEDFLKFVEVQTPPYLQFTVVPLWHFWRGAIIVSTRQWIFLLQDLLGDVAPCVRICTEKLLHQIREILFRRKNHATARDRVSFRGASCFVWFIYILVDLDALEETNRPPGMLGAFFILEWKSELILIVVLPSDYRVALPRELV